MKQTNIIRVIYNQVSEILKDSVKAVPKLEITNAKTYFGSISFDGMKFNKICISKYELDCYNINSWKQSDFDEMIDTICHEFAHEYTWTHGKKHARLTEEFKAMVNQTVTLESITRLI